jgi:hypothetical protein
MIGFCLSSCVVSITCKRQHPETLLTVTNFSKYINAEIPLIKCIKCSSKVKNFLSKPVICVCNGFSEEKKHQAINKFFN